MHEQPRNRALDAWDYRAPFSPFHITWGEGDAGPAFGADQAYGMVQQDLRLHELMEVWAHREVLVTFSSEHIQVGRGPADREPAWVVVAVGVKKPGGAGEKELLAGVVPGGGVVLQALLHERTGEVLLGTAVPVELRPA